MAAPKDLVTISYEDLEYDWIPPNGDFIVKVQPIIARQVNLCGYVINFERKRHPKTGKWTYPIYTFDSRKFPPRNINPGAKCDLKTVLPEIIKKITNPLQPVVRITQTESVKTERVKTKEK